MEFAARRGRCILADEMGLGKTLQAIGTAALLHREGYISSVLIVCPTSLKYQWKREIKSFVGAEALVIEGSQPVRKELYDRQDAYKIVSQMVAGTGALQIETGKNPGTMVNEVATPGGVTIKGVTALREADFHEVVAKAIDAIEK